MRTKIHHKQASHKSQPGNWLLIAIALLGVLLVIGGLLAYAASHDTAVASAEYQANEVANNQPFVAVHEMGEKPPIPFLPRNEPQPKIQVPEKSYDFGTVGPKDVVEREFIIRNTGEAPLTISRAYTTCGCTTAEISARVIQPGQVATVRLVFDAGFHDAAGQTVRRGLIIENNDPNQSQAEIWVQASVQSR